MGDPISPKRLTNDDQTTERGTTNRGVTSRGVRPHSPKLTRSVPKALQATQVLLHFYLPTPLSAQGLIEFLDYAKDGPGRFSLAGLTLVPFDRKDTAVADFTRSLQVPGAIVVYMGHTSFLMNAAKTEIVQVTGLNPAKAKVTPITKAHLRSLLAKTKAEMVVIAGCSSDALINKAQRSPAVILTTDSGRNGTTDSSIWMRAIASMLCTLVGARFDGASISDRVGGPGSINDAINESTPLFNSDDHFVLAIGDGSRTLQ